MDVVLPAVRLDKLAAGWYDAIINDRRESRCTTKGRFQSIKPLSEGKVTP